MHDSKGPRALARAILECEGCHVAVMRAVGVHAAPGEADPGLVNAAFRQVRLASRTFGAHHETSSDVDVLTVTGSCGKVLAAAGTSPARCSIDTRRRALRAGVPVNPSRLSQAARGAVGVPRCEALGPPLCARSFPCAVVWIACELELLAGWRRSPDHFARGVCSVDGRA